MQNKISQLNKHKVKIIANLNTSSTTKCSQYKEIKMTMSNKNRDTKYNDKECACVCVCVCVPHDVVAGAWERNRGVVLSRLSHLNQLEVIMLIESSSPETSANKKPWN